MSDEIPKKPEYEIVENDDMDINSSISSIPRKKSFLKQFISGEFVTNIILAGLFSVFLSVFYNSYNETPKFSTLLMMIQVSCIVLFFLIRISPSKTSMDPKDWTIAIIATYLPMIITPVDAQGEIAILFILQLIGILISIAGLISLNNSIGIVPAVRGIKKKGLYSLIRHPIYLGYFISMSAMVLQNLTILNIIIIIAIYATEIYRIFAEEKLLSEDPEYQEYKKRVKWRLLPFIW